MKVVVLGGSGFIGKRFGKLYSEKFDEVVLSDSKSTRLNDFASIERLTDGADVVVHAAFDHSYKYNIEGIKNVLKACRVNGVKKLVYLSTVSVFDPLLHGSLNENCPKSDLKDPYTVEKIKVEQELRKNLPDEPSVVILYPTIVYGLEGNWTTFALNACAGREVALPLEGRGLCNAVYVDDVAQAIYKSCAEAEGSMSVLISASETVTWREFYDGHLTFLNAVSGKNVKCSFSDSNDNEFHVKPLHNILMKLLFKTPLGGVILPLLIMLKKLRANHYTPVKNGFEILTFLDSADRNRVTHPLGITRTVHFSKFKTDISEATKILGFRPEYTFKEGIEAMIENYRREHQ